MLSLASIRLAALRLIVYAVTFSTICPWALLLGGVGLTLSYVRVSILLAVRFERPPRLGDAIAKMTELMLPGVVFCHAWANFFLLVRWWFGKKCDAKEKGCTDEDGWHLFVWLCEHTTYFLHSEFPAPRLLLVRWCRLRDDGHLRSQGSSAASVSGDSGRCLGQAGSSWCG